MIVAVSGAPKWVNRLGSKGLDLLSVKSQRRPSDRDIEVNPRAAAITDLVLWIGYLQWHFRTRGDDELREPIIRWQLGRAASLHCSLLASRPGNVMA